MSKVNIEMEPFQIDDDDDGNVTTNTVSTDRSVKQHGTYQNIPYHDNVNDDDDENDGILMVDAVMVEYPRKTIVMGNNNNYDNDSHTGNNNNDMYGSDYNNDNNNHSGGDYIYAMDDHYNNYDDKPTWMSERMYEYLFKI